MPPAFVDGILADAPDLNLPSSSNTVRNSSTTVKHRARAKSARQWAGQQRQMHQTLGSLVGLGLLAAGAWAAWRWWKGRVSAQGQEGAAAQQKAPQRKHKKSGYASPFSFDRKKSSNANQEPFAALQALPARNIPHVNYNAPKGKGNRKKDKKSRKEAKHAMERERREADNVAAVIAARAKEKGIAEAGKAPDTGLVTTHSYEANAEAFQRVQQWQETGKKMFK